jgi:hypothetical protein
MEKNIIQTIFEDSTEDITVHSYSGRAMYGKCCVGLTMDNVSDMLPTLLAEVTDDNRNALIRAFGNTRTDSMGRGVVVYFPNIPFVEEGQEDG